MIGTIEFYNIPGSLASGEYPILRSGQSVTSYRLATFTNCKYTKDLLQVIGPFAVSSFSSYDQANLCKIGTDWYWVTSFKTDSLQQESVSFGLVYNAPMSKLTINQSVSGVWARTPTRTCPYLTATISNDAMEHSRSIGLPTIKSLASALPRDCNYYWVEIAGTVTNSGGDKELRYYGFFAARTDPTNRTVNVYPYRSYGSGKPYPPLEALFGNGTVLGMFADEILQVSISERCPYGVDAIYESSKIKIDAKTGAVTPSVTEIGNYCVYEVLTALNWGFASNTVTVSLSDDERTFGSTRIVDGNGTVIATLPHQYGSSISLSVKTYGDMTGIHTTISIDDRLIATIQEGHLPWLGNAWTEYQGRQMEGDRQIAALSNQQAVAELDISMKQSMMNQRFREVDYVMSAAGSASIWNPAGAIVGAVGAGVGILEAEVQGGIERAAMQKKTEYDLMATDLNQQLTEKQMQTAAGTVYSAGYGLSYLISTLNHPAHIQVEMPANFTTSYRANYMEQFGWPAEGLRSVSISSGYIQGKLLAATSLGSGPKFDDLAAVFAKGFKIREI